MRRLNWLAANFASWPRPSEAQGERGEQAATHDGHPHVEARLSVDVAIRSGVIPAFIAGIHSSA